MSQRYFLPSEIARLILGYLQQEGYKDTFTCFLNECPYLTEYLDLLRSGHNYPTSLTILGLTLRTILQEYAHTKLCETNREHSSEPTLKVWTEFEAVLAKIKWHVLDENRVQPKTRVNPDNGSSVRRSHKKRSFTRSRTCRNLTGAPLGRRCRGQDEITRGIEEKGGSVLSEATDSPRLRDYERIACVDTSLNVVQESPLEGRFSARKFTAQSSEVGNSTTVFSSDLLGSGNTSLTLVHDVTYFSPHGNLNDNNSEVLHTDVDISRRHFSGVACRPLRFTDDKGIDPPISVPTQRANNPEHSVAFTRQLIKNTDCPQNLREIYPLNPETQSSAHLEPNANDVSRSEDALSREIISYTAYTPKTPCVVAERLSTPPSVFIEHSTLSSHTDTCDVDRFGRNENCGHAVSTSGGQCVSKCRGELNDGCGYLTARTDSGFNILSNFTPIVSFSNMKACGDDGLNAIERNAINLEVSSSVPRTENVGHVSTLSSNQVSFADQLNCSAETSNREIQMREQCISLGESQTNIIPVPMTPVKVNSGDQPLIRTPRRKRQQPRKRSFPHPHSIQEASTTSKKGTNEIVSASDSNSESGVPLMVEKILEDSSIPERLAEKINARLHAPTHATQLSAPATRTLSLEEILSIDEESMSTEAVHNIIDQTRIDPDFDALFKIFETSLNNIHPLSSALTDGPDTGSKLSDNTLTTNTHLSNQAFCDSDAPNSVSLVAVVPGNERSLESASNHDDGDNSAPIVHESPLDEDIGLSPHCRNNAETAIIGHNHQTELYTPDDHPLTNPEGRTNVRDEVASSGGLQGMVTPSKVTTIDSSTLSLLSGTVPTSSAKRRVLSSTKKSRKRHKSDINISPMMKALIHAAKSWDDDTMDESDQLPASGQQSASRPRSSVNILPKRSSERIVNIETSVTSNDAGTTRSSSLVNLSQFDNKQLGDVEVLLRQTASGTSDFSRDLCDENEGHVISVPDDCTTDECTVLETTILTTNEGPAQVLLNGDGMPAYLMLENGTVVPLDVDGQRSVYDMVKHSIGEPNGKTNQSSTPRSSGKGAIVSESCVRRDGALGNPLNSSTGVSDRQTRGSTQLRTNSRSTRSQYIPKPLSFGEIRSDVEGRKRRKIVMTQGRRRDAMKRQHMYLSDGVTYNHALHMQMPQLVPQLVQSCRYSRTFDIAPPECSRMKTGHFSEISSGRVSTSCLESSGRKTRTKCKSIVASSMVAMDSSASEEMDVLDSVEQKPVIISPIKSYETADDIKTNKKKGKNALSNPVNRLSKAVAMGFVRAGSFDNEMITKKTKRANKYTEKRDLSASNNKVDNVRVTRSVSKSLSPTKNVVRDENIASHSDSLSFVSSDAHLFGNGKSIGSRKAKKDQQFERENDAPLPTASNLRDSSGKSTKNKSQKQSKKDNSPRIKTQKSRVHKENKSSEKKKRSPGPKAQKSLSNTKEKKNIAKTKIMCRSPVVRKPTVCRQVLMSPDKASTERQGQYNCGLDPSGKSAEVTSFDSPNTRNEIAEALLCMANTPVKRSLVRPMTPEKDSVDSDLSAYANVPVNRIVLSEDSDSDDETDSVDNMSGNCSGRTVDFSKSLTHNRVKLLNRTDSSGCVDLTINSSSSTPVKDSTNCPLDLSVTKTVGFESERSPEKADTGKRNDGVRVDKDSCGVNKEMSRMKKKFVVRRVDKENNLCFNKSVKISDFRRKAVCEENEKTGHSGMNSSERSDERCSSSRSDERPSSSRNDERSSSSSRDGRSSSSRLPDNRLGSSSQEKKYVNSLIAKHVREVGNADWKGNRDNQSAGNNRSCNEEAENYMECETASRLLERSADDDNRKLMNYEKHPSNELVQLRLETSPESTIGQEDSDNDCETLENLATPYNEDDSATLKGVCSDAVTDVVQSASGDSVVLNVQTCEKTFEGNTAMSVFTECCKENLRGFTEGRSTECVRIETSRLNERTRVDESENVTNAGLSSLNVPLVNQSERGAVTGDSCVNISSGIDAVKNKKRNNKKKRNRTDIDLSKLDVDKFLSKLYK